MPANSQGLIDGPLWYDPFQMHQVAMNLRKKGILCEEFNQGNERTLADTFLHQQYKDGTIDNYPDHLLAAHIAAAKAKEVEGEKLRLIKGTLSGSLKIDAAVAQSMAVYKSSTAVSAGVYSINDVSGYVSPVFTISDIFGD